jgi:hypothetical protein
MSVVPKLFIAIDQNDINKAKELIQKSGGPGWFCLILVLAMIALFLFFLVVYT